MDLTTLLVDPTGVQTWKLGESELLSSTTELSQRICELEALRLRMVHDVDTRGAAKTLGASSTAAWLSLGRKQRLVSPQQRRALVARDHGCSFPGCGRPAAWTEAHHIVHWISGGATNLANLTLLCRAHHRIVHHGGWDVTVGADQHPWFLPLEWLDPLREPRPAHHRQVQVQFVAARRVGGFRRGPAAI